MRKNKICVSHPKNIINSLTREGVEARLFTLSEKLSTGKRESFSTHYFT